MRAGDDRQLRRMLADRDTLRRLVTKLTDQTLEDLHRRGAQVAGHDGYPPGGGESGGSGPGRPTEMAALALVDGATERDNVGRWIAEVAALLDHLAGAAVDVEGRLGLLAKAGSTERPNTVELCAECNEPAPRVTRFDGQPYHPGKCYMRAYRRSGRGREVGYGAYPRVEEA